MDVRVLVGVLSIPFTVGVFGQSLRPSEPAWFTPAAVERQQPSSPAQPAKGRFLIASRALLDPNFAETVVLLLDADARGAMGIIINHPTKTTLADVLPDEKVLRDRPDRVFLGGPIGTNVMLLLVRAHSAPAKAEKIVDDVYATGSMSTLRDAVGRKGKTDGRLRAYAGYAGWGPGQLEREIARGDWLLGSGDAATVFDLRPADIWPKLIERFSGAWTSNDTFPASKMGMRAWGLEGFGA